MPSVLNETKVTAAFRCTLTGAVDLGSIVHRFSWERALSYVDGAGAGAVNLLWTDKRQIAASSNDDIDLAGALVDALGAAVVFARVKAIGVYAWSANTNNVVVGNHPTAAFVGPFGGATHTHALQPGSVYEWGTPTAAGFAVTATTADILRIANSGAGTVVDYEIAILGAAS